jgi:hypothetical protein
LANEWKGAGRRTEGDAESTAKSQQVLMLKERKEGKEQTVGPLRRSF